MRAIHELVLQLYATYAPNLPEVILGKSILRKAVDQSTFSPEYHIMYMYFKEV